MLHFLFKNAKKLHLFSHYLKDFTPSYYLDEASLSKTYDMQLKQRNSTCGASGSPCPFESESKLNAFILYKWKWKNSLSESETVSFSSVQCTQCIGGRKGKKLNLYCVFACVLQHRSHLCVTCIPLNFCLVFFCCFLFLLKCVYCLSVISSLTPDCDKCGSYQVCNIGQSLSFYGDVFLWMVVWNSTREVHENKSSTVSHVIEYSLLNIDYLKIYTVFCFTLVFLFICFSSCVDCNCIIKDILGYPLITETFILNISIAVLNNLIRHSWLCCSVYFWYFVTLVALG